MSANHQLTVPMAVAAASSVAPGDRFRVESDGTGRFLMTRIEEYMQRCDRAGFPRRTRSRLPVEYPWKAATAPAAA